jgi:hypothetical protein
MCRKPTGANVAKQLARDSAVEQISGQQDSRLLPMSRARTVGGEMDQHSGSARPEAAAQHGNVELHEADATALPIEDAAAALVPGGALYYEVDRTKRRSRHLTPRVVRRVLQRHGLASQSVYWVRPNFAERKLYLPLDNPGALRWYLRTILPGATPKEWLSARLLRAASRELDEGDGNQNDENPEGDRLGEASPVDGLLRRFR